MTAEEASGGRFLSVCSGIEAASVAWRPLGFEAVAFAETEKFPSAVLAHHYPGVPNWGDITKFKDWPDAKFDVLVGGTPCQGFSVAGLRKGLDDPRARLVWSYLAIAGRYRPEWLVWENVPGVLSLDGGRCFGAILGRMAQLGYGCAYRILDAQYSGVPQRRRRVFVVGHLGDWRRAAAVLFERHGLSGDSAPRREAGEGTTHPIAPSLGASGRGFERAGDPRGQDAVVAFAAPTLRSGDFDRSHANGGVMPTVAFDTYNQSLSDQAATLRDPNGTFGDALPAVMIGSHRADATETGPREALRALRDTLGAEATCEWQAGVLASFSETKVLRSSVRWFSAATQAELLMGDGPLARAQRLPAGAMLQVWESGRLRRSPPGRGFSEQLSRELDAALSGLPPQGTPPPWLLRDLRRTSEGAGLLQQALPPAQGRATAVRRLTPRECERLQGFPDDYTAITYRGKPAADGPRYKALGNSMAVPVMRWIGERIARASS